MKPSSTLTASWIWHRQDSYTPYHQVILGRRSFRLAQAVPGTLKIAVDGGYRLLVNEQWVADGPARNWPEHFQYDEINLAPYLRSGNNEIKVLARHWQVGDFHTRPQQAGLLVQLDLKLPGGHSRRIASDQSWQTAWLPAWAANTPKVSIQMEPQELYDARMEDGLQFSPAAVLYPAQDGPWRDLHARDVALLARRPLHPQRIVGASLVKHPDDLNFCLPAVRLAIHEVHPRVSELRGSQAGPNQPVEANHMASAAGGMATVLELPAPAEIHLALEGMLASIDGEINEDGVYALAAGRHSLQAFAWPMFGHRKERSLRIAAPPAGLRLINPLEAEHANPWVYLAMPQFALAENDLDWTWFSGPEGRREAAAQEYGGALAACLTQSFDAHTRGPLSARQMPAEEMFVTDTHWQFVQRQALGDAGPYVEHPAALIHDNPELTTVHPAGAGDIELAYDLGQQTVGYFEFELLAPAGVQVDLYGVEYLKPDGTIQHTGDNHNGLRYITRAGLNHFISLKRRAGRYLFLTLRNLTEPVQLRLLRVVEATYPAEHKAYFECSDANLGRIWQIAARTLELCMEDTFTDCPLYEQTYWVGDARNESLFAYDAFGATDIPLRCLRLAAQSLERYPLVGGQVPSSWDMLLPAWSFLWGVAVWDYYFYTADRDALAELWPWVVRNLQGAEGLLDANGLFSGKFWNMFDWTPVDDRHPTVLHNSLLLVGALEAAQKMANVLEDKQHAAWLEGLRTRLAAAINRWWDPQKGAYPDSVHADGSPSLSTCVHTSFLALLYDVIPPELLSAALGNILNPPEDMVRVGSPFAILYLYEALAKAGKPEEILRSIYENYLPMLTEGATTVWEVFPTSGDRPSGFPTRSHTHAWSSAPVHFLPQVVLGIRQTAPGGMAYTISPWIDDLAWARGAVCTARGLLEVSWRRTEGRLEISVRAPEGSAVTFEGNPSLADLDIKTELTRH
jgi:alpha-L-rhamnosidase